MNSKGGFLLFRYLFSSPAGGCWASLLGEHFCLALPLVFRAWPCHFGPAPGDCTVRARPGAGDLEGTGGGGHWVQAGTVTHARKQPSNE
jgi:hypothetical protein